MSALIIFITAPLITYIINIINSLDKSTVYSILLFSFFYATQNVLNIAFVKMQNCNKIRLTLKVSVMVPTQCMLVVHVKAR